MPYIIIQHDFMDGNEIDDTEHSANSMSNTLAKLVELTASREVAGFHFSGMEDTVQLDDDACLFSLGFANSETGEECVIEVGTVE